MGRVSIMRLTKDPQAPRWTMEAQTPEEEELLEDVLDALVLKFPPNRPRGITPEPGVPKRSADAVTPPGP